MHWIRKNSRFGSWAAVFALALQLALSFGHIHAEDFQDRWSATAWSSQPNPNSPDNDDRGPGHDFCAICAALNLTSSSVLPAVAVLNPGRSTLQLGRCFTSRGRFLPRSFYFPARAPPYSV